jgi:hypothetical protein
MHAVSAPSQHADTHLDAGLLLQDGAAQRLHQAPLLLGDRPLVAAAAARLAGSREGGLVLYSGSSGRHVVVVDAASGVAAADLLGTAGAWDEV